MKILNRPQAIALNSQHYFTGRPCKRGHVARRYVSSSMCVECETAKAKIRWATDMVAQKARVAKWRAENKAHLEVYSEKTKPHKRASWHKNRAHFLEKRAVYYQTHKDVFAKKASAYAASHPEVFKDIAHRRRARLLNAPGVHTKEEVAALLITQDHKCAGCSKKLNKLHRDHIIPISKGGSNYISNIQLMCKSCNSSKKDKLPHEWQKT